MLRVLLNRKVGVTMNKLLKLLTVGAGAMIISTSAWAGLVIGFEEGEGYDTGNLVDQPSSGTQWDETNPAAAVGSISVVDGIGVGGSRGIRGAANTGSDHNYYGFNTSDTDLGFTFDSESSILSYSFDWRPTQELDGGGSFIFRLAIGSASDIGASGAAEFIVRADGRFIAVDADSNRARDNLFTLNEYSTISGVIDYGANTYTVWVDGEQQFTTSGPNGDGNLGFVNTASDNAYIRIGNLSGTTADHREWNLDNISIIPEPSAVALLGLGMVTVLAVRRRRRS